MASSPQTAPSIPNNETATIPIISKAENNKTSAPSESPPEPTPAKESPPPPTTDSSPPPPVASPPPDPPKSSPSPPPPSTPSPPPPEKSGSPPSENKDSPSPPPPNSSTLSPPPSSKTPSTPSPANSPPSPVFSPPSQDPKSPPSLSPPLRPSGDNRTSSTPAPPKTQSPSSSSSSSSSGVSQSTIIAIAVAGVAVIALLVICILFSRKKKKRPYYVEPGRPPKDPYYNMEPQWNNPQPGLDHIVKLPPPPGVMGTPVGGPGGWGAPPPPPQANTSSDFSSGYSGQHPTPMQPPSPNMGGIGAKSQFTYEELAVATRGFDQSNLLGQGGFGFVHKGVLPDRREVAVKSLKSGSGQGEREFQAEVEIISRVHHRHLVSLVGYCITDGQRMLVYEFVSNKTLEFHLHGKGQPVMDWPTRLRIAIGSAKGLAYLHEDCHLRIIHRDIKSANILLDDKFEAMVADFGLAKLSSDNYTHVSTRVMGTFGYLAPEYASSGKLTEKSDVFSFGVMLLELITGRRPVDPTNRTMEDSLVDWARPLMSKALEDGNYDELVDPRLEHNYLPHEMARMVSCAAASIRHSARRRPKMSQIVRALDGASSLDDLNEGVKSGQSTSYNPNGKTEVYDTRAYDADMMKFRQMVMNDQENSSEFGATSEYGINPSSSSCDSREMGKIPEKQKL